MKAIILTSTYYKPHFGGVENSLYYLGQAYKELGYEVYIIASDADHTKKNRVPISQYLEDQVNVIRYKSYFPKINFDYLIKPYIEIYRIKKTLEKIETSCPIELVLARSPENVLAAWLGKYRVAYLVPGIVKTQNKVETKSVFDFKNIATNLLVVSNLSYLQKKAINKAHNVFVFSKNMESQIRDQLSKNLKINHVSPGVDTERFGNEFTNIRMEHHIPENATVFLVVGRLIKDKGIAYAVRALSKVRNKNSYLLVVGDGPERIPNQILAENLKIEERVIFVGRISDNVEHYYKAADVFLMTSIHESFGQTILEALASGLPIIAWKSSEEIKTATSEIIQHNSNGFLIDFDENLLVKAMDKYVYMDEGDKHTISNANISLAKTRYSWGKLALDISK